MATPEPSLEERLGRFQFAKDAAFGSNIRAAQINILKVLAKPGVLLHSDPDIAQDMLNQVLNRAFKSDDEIVRTARLYQVANLPENMAEVSGSLRAIVSSEFAGRTLSGINRTLSELEAKIGEALGKAKDKGEKAAVISGAGNMVDQVSGNILGFIGAYAGLNQNAIGQSYGAYIQNLYNAVKAKYGIKG
ncbi:MAG: hypothetical protein OH319_02745 [Candidatus Parvarchaeota archaeon]|nr:hypothetical protein [Candidatus Jingweiarchaeum tengchongense]MCW1298287.1 hypothetical protein [Candidatus Jingweiarchaeum tengchongense]MCW1300378.1 hypothetical protein [Candidatus Jingweiarchaeum tengchongense]MCW1304777.1 hypothetical protein [Candidatus Jingweiarchaeum tengchongense]MCW1305367.1 hypothetical protein [Candidatus Jingweiarchaeum tengchongense]